VRSKQAGGGEMLRNFSGGAEKTQGLFPGPEREKIDEFVPQVQETKRREGGILVVRGEKGLPNVGKAAAQKARIEKNIPRETSIRRGGENPTQKKETNLKKKVDLKRKRDEGDLV